MRSGSVFVSKALCSQPGVSYIFNEAGFSTTSFGISANGVLAAFGGVFMNDGGNPGGRFAVREVIGSGATVVAPGTLGSMPAARSLSSNELGSGTGRETGGAAGGGSYELWS